MNVETLKKMMSEKKNTLPSLKHQNWKTVKAETEKINELLVHISSNITELNDRIYAGANLVCAKIGSHLYNANRNS